MLVYELYAFTAVQFWEARRHGWDGFFFGTLECIDTYCSGFHVWIICTDIVSKMLQYPLIAKAWFTVLDIDIRMFESR